MFRTILIGLLIGVLQMLLPVSCKIMFLSVAILTV